MSNNCLHIWASWNDHNADKKWLRRPPRLNCCFSDPGRPLLSFSACAVLSPKLGPCPLFWCQNMFRRYHLASRSPARWTTTTKNSCVQSCQWWIVFSIVHLDANYLVANSVKKSAKLTLVSNCPIILAVKVVMKQKCFLPTILRFLYFPGPLTTNCYVYLFWDSAIDKMMGWLLYPFVSYPPQFVLYEN